MMVMMMIMKRLKRTDGHPRSDQESKPLHHTCVFLQTICALIRGITRVCRAVFFFNFIGTCVSARQSAMRIERGQLGNLANRLMLQSAVPVLC